MATIVLSAAGLALGGSMGGSVLGLSTGVIGRAIGAALGRSIDQRLFGQGSEPVSTGRIDRFRLTGASEGTGVAQGYGKLRMGGQVIWATQFVESSESARTGKRGPTVTSYSYSLSLAIALCEGEISGIGRIWADGAEIPADDLTLRVYTGSQDQLPDPRMEAVEGAGAVPAYRGIAYVVIEDLDLGRFGNRLPQFSFEVSRPSAPGLAPEDSDISRLIEGVALVPGSGEYALATTPVYKAGGFAEKQPLNVSSPSGVADLVASMNTLETELPACQSVSLVVSWFGDDLRAGACTLRPRAESLTGDPAEMTWKVSGTGRAEAGLVPFQDGIPVYGGTPADQSVLQAIAEIKSRGKSVVFYPFILMDQIAGNTRPDPWSGAAEQPALPWRGRITTSLAPGQPGSPDGTATAEAEVAAFFGTAAPGQFSAAATTVNYAGPDQWSYRRFILHYARLCQLAGGVSAFCIGSEMRSLTQIRGAGGSYPAVAALTQLAADVRAILGPDTKIGYAADWSEYHGHQPGGTSDKIFHLDPLWADANVDFIGIDNYMPLSDWRDGEDHLDAKAGVASVYDLDYLRSNVAGGEGFDWFYHSPEARAAQIRTPITDDEGEPWIWRYKDIRNWWSLPHHDRIDGMRNQTPTVWVPQSKPIWFTEFGCAAVDKATNEPNRFVDAKSSETGLPHFSSGKTDELIQHQYIKAVISHYTDAEANPISPLYNAPMVDMSRAHVWAWDARPYPQFPARSDLWSDAANHTLGHWISGRATHRSLASVVREICGRSGLSDVNTAGLHGLLRGYGVNEVDTARAALQPLQLAYGFDVVDRDGALHFISRGRAPLAEVAAGDVVLQDPATATIEENRAAAAEIAGRVRIVFIDANRDYETRAEEAVIADEASLAVSQTDFPLVLTPCEGRAIAERWLCEARVGRDTVRFALPPSRIGIRAGDAVKLETAQGPTEFRIDRIETTEHQLIDATRIDRDIYRPRRLPDLPMQTRPFTLAVPVEGLFLDLPLLTGDEDPYAPDFAATADPFPGPIALYSSARDGEFNVNQTLEKTSVIGVTQTALAASPNGIWDRGPALRVKLVQGALSSASPGDLLSGANVAAIGNGTADDWEVLQFAEAELVGPDTYDLRLRLRGQAGSDGIMPAEWPVGSLFVLLDGATKQITSGASLRGVTQNFRYGPALRPIDDASFRAAAFAFAGNGLRPYRPAHLKATQDAEGLKLSWIRRTRKDGDSWSGVEVPLNEEVESYILSIRQGAVLLRQNMLPSAGFTYPVFDQAADGALGDVTIEVAQVSAIFGAGPAAKITVTLA